MVFRHRARSIVVAGVMALGLSNLAGAGAPPAPPAESLVPADVLDRHDLQVYWRCTLPLAKGEQILRVTRIDENIYVQATSGRLFCIHAKVGVLRWMVSFAKPDETFWPPSHNPDREDYLVRIAALRERLRDAEALRLQILEGVQANPRLPEIVQTYVNKYQANNTDRKKQFEAENLIKADGRYVGAEVANVRSSYDRELSELVTYAELVTIGTNTTAYNFDLRTGELRRKMDYGFAASSGPVSNGEFFFVGGADQRFYALSPDTGGSAWEVKSGAPTVAKPVYHLRRVYWVDSDGVVMSSDASRKTDTWQVDLGGRVTANITHDRLGLFISSSDQSLYLVSDTVGRVRSQLRVNGPVRQPATVTRQFAYAEVTDVGLHVAKVPELQLAFVRPDCTQLAAQMDAKTAYLRTTSGALAKVSLADGKTLDTLPVSADTMVVANDLDASLLLASAGGVVECLKPDDVPYLRRSMIDQVPNLSVAYTKIVERAALETTLSEYAKQLEELLAPEPMRPAELERENWLASEYRNLPASGAIDRASASGQPAGGGAPAEPAPAAPAAPAEPAPAAPAAPATP